ncbi:MBL fold metallo-hydrolase [Promicromonospora sp. MEB111]|uniref:MBL fold metallo-hydrolase n=1 Tax=Promicromonospora sp. MEB111 TaxID=3040301 RepID=UPI00254AE36D|nr:MBL fold metallo-hydrolase [Promicromonospora sp. MEB111]
MLRADNPGPMTLDGTRSYVLRAPGSPGCVVVDPGPDLTPHLAALADAGPVDLVLVTHRHADHTGGLATFRELTGAPSRGVLPEFCAERDGGAGSGGVGAGPLADGEVLEVAGLRIEVLATPGHTADSVCLVVSDGTSSVVLTGDTVLGRGTTVLAEPDGSLREYLASLDRLSALDLPDPVPGLPGHGPVLPDLRAVVHAYREHRTERLGQVRSALTALGVTLPDAGAPLPEPILDAVTGAVYADVDASVLPAARSSVRAQLEYLRGRPEN